MLDGVGNCGSRVAFEGVDMLTLELVLTLPW